MSNRFKGEVSLPIAGETYTLVFTINTLIEIEESWGKDVKDIGELISEEPKLSDLRKLFHFGLKEFHPEVDERGAGNLMSNLGVLAASTALARAFAAAFNGSEVSEGAALPPDNAAPADGTGAPA